MQETCFTDTLQSSLLVRNGHAESHEIRIVERGIFKERAKIVHLERNVHHVQSHHIYRCIVYEWATAVRNRVADYAEDPSGFTLESNFVSASAISALRERQ